VKQRPNKAKEKVKIDSIFMMSYFLLGVSNSLQCGHKKYEVQALVNLSSNGTSL
jgi:hypothetical protein